MINEDVKKQDAANAQAQKQFDDERQRKNTIQNKAKELRVQAGTLEKANKAVRDEISGFKEICNGADLLELRATNDALTLEGTELRASLAQLKKIAGVV